MTLYFRLLYLLFFLSAGTVASFAQAGKSVSAETFGALPEIANVQISPDGSKVLMLRNIEGKFTLVTRLLDEPEQENIIPYDEGLYNWAIWASDERIVASVRYRGHEDRSMNLRVASQRRLLSMHWDGSDIINPHRFRKIGRTSRRFTVRQPQNQDRIIDVLKDDPDHILVQMDLDERSETGVYKININSRKRTRVLQPRRAVDFWMTDHEHQVRYGEGRNERSGSDESRHVAFYRKSVKDSWITLFDYDEIVNQRPFYFEGFSKDPDIVYVTANDEHGKLALFSYDVNRGQTVEKIAGNREMDIVDVSINEELEIEKYSFYKEKPTIIRLTDRGRQLDTIIDEHFPDKTATITSESKDKNDVVLSVSAPTSPTSYYHVDIKNAEVKKIADAFPNIDETKLSNKIPIFYSARDSLEIPAYLSLPKQGSDKNLPTIIMPHGGPMARDGWNFDYWVQFLTTRGYAVLQMNYRGSTGYGEDFLRMGHHEWGRKMLEDINDGTRFMIEQGYTDPNRICMMGGSYGGYAALQSIVLGEFDYKCAVSFAPITNLPGLLQFFKGIDGYKAYKNYIESDEWSMEDASPSYNVDKINVPVLLMQGTKDLNVTPLQARGFHRRMRDAGKNITYIEFEDGDHFLSNEKHRIQFLSESEKFLAEHLE